MELVKRIVFSYAGIAILMKYTLFIGLTSTSSSRNITSHKLSLACKLQFSVLSIRKRARLLVARGEVHEWGKRAAELFGRNSPSKQNRKIHKSKPFDVQLWERRRKKETYFPIVSFDCDCKWMDKDHNFGHSYSPVGLTLWLPVGGGLLFPSPG